MKIINEEQVVKLYETKTIKEISKELGSYPNKISSILIKNGIKPKSKFTVKKIVNDTFFDEINCEEKAYILGFFIADGCIRKEVDKRCGSVSYRMCFSNSIDDYDVIKIIHDRICPNNKLIEIHNTSDGANRKKQINVQWTSRHMVDVLINKYGICTDKTKNINFELAENLIPELYMPHFIRGVIDGDGTVGKYDIRIVLNSKKFGEQIVSFFKKKFENKSDVVEDFIYTINECKGKTVNYWRLRIPIGKGRKKLMRKILYENANIFLKRKKEKIYE